MAPRLVDPEDLFRRAGVPAGEPFRASSTGLHSKLLHELTLWGYLRRLSREVYVRCEVPDTLGLRSRAVALVLAPGAVVTDVTAAWLHGIDLLPAKDLSAVPEVCAFHVDKGGRVMRNGVTSGQRMMPESDITEVNGVPVTTMLRTACDLGRLQWRERAFAALDAFLHAGVDKDELLINVDRFGGYRGVRQLRAFAPLADGRADSVAESIMRLRWLDAGLPTPSLQCPVDGPGATWFLDLGLEDLYYAVEYDGAEFHSSPEQVEHDRSRREWIAANTPWIVDVIGKDMLFTDDMGFEAMVRRRIAEARQTLANRVRGRRWFVEPGE